MPQKLVLILTLMLSGRAMTLAFIGRAGGTGPGDPPAAWLMPLIGDAVVGISALVVAWLVVYRRGLWVWSAAMLWNAVAIWDALSAWIVHLTNPWPEFFMLQMVGPVMFFAASAMHVAIMVLLCRTPLREQYLGTAAD